MLAWNSFDYDPRTDTCVCIADSDGSELMTVCTAGKVISAPGVITAPDFCDDRGPVDLTESTQVQSV